MAGHNTVSAGSDRGAEGNQFQFLQTLPVSVNHRKIDVRIRGGVAVPWKMLCSCKATVFLHAAHKLGHVLSDFLWVFAEGTRVDNGIVGIVVDVGVGRVNPMDA